MAVGDYWRQSIGRFWLLTMRGRFPRLKRRIYSDCLKTKFLHRSTFFRSFDVELSL